MKKLLALMLLCSLSGCAQLETVLDGLLDKLDPSETEEPAPTPEPGVPSVPEPVRPKPTATPVPASTPRPAEGACLPGPDNRIGFDIVALQHPLQDIQAITDLMPPKVPVGWLDGTFTQNVYNVEQLLKTRKVTKAIVAIFNGPGIRNGQTVDSDGPVRGMSKSTFSGKLEQGDAALRDYYKARVGFYKELAAKYPCTQFYVKPILEHDVSERAFKAVADWTHQVWPNVKLINSPTTGWNGNYRGSCLEKHGENTSGACASSLDGKSLYNIDRNGWRNRTVGQLYTLSWIEAANCRNVGQWLPPLERRACLTRESFKNWLQKTYE